MRYNRKLHRYIGLVVGLFWIMWTITGFLLLNIPWYQEEAKDLKTTSISVPENNRFFTISYIGQELVETREYKWEEIHSISKSGDVFKVYIHRDPILRLTIDKEGSISALKQSPILDLFYGLHTGEWESINYVLLLKVISILSMFLTVTGFIYFLPKRWFKKKSKLINQVNKVA